MTIKAIETFGFLPSHCSRMEQTNLLQSGPMMWTLDKSDSISFFYAIGIDTSYQVNLFDIKITFCVSRGITGQHDSWFFFLIHRSTCTMVAAVIVLAQWIFRLLLWQHSVPLFPLLIGSSSGSLFIWVRKISDFPRKIIIILGVFIDTLVLYCCLQNTHYLSANY